MVYQSEKLFTQRLYRSNNPGNVSNGCYYVETDDYVDFDVFLRGGVQSVSMLATGIIPPAWLKQPAPQGCHAQVSLANFAVDWANPKYCEDKVMLNYNGNCGINQNQHQSIAGGHLTATLHFDNDWIPPKDIWFVQ